MLSDFQKNKHICGKHKIWSGAFAWLFVEKLILQIN